MVMCSNSAVGYQRGLLMYKMPPPIEDVRLVAWHHMINDPYLITYTMVNGKPRCEWVNEKLALRRAMLMLSQTVEQITHDFIIQFKPTFESIEEVFQQFANSFKQAGLHDLLTDQYKVE